MIYLIAVLFPWLALILKGHIIKGVLCFILQITLIGWLPALIWAIVVINNDEANARNKKLIRAIKNG